MEIEVTIESRGDYAGINPLVSMWKKFKNNGELEVSIRRLYSGLESKKAQIPRKDLLSLADFLLKNDFFSLRDCYGCKREDLPPDQARPIVISAKIGKKEKKVEAVVGYPDWINIFSKKADDIVKKYSEKE